MDIEVQSKSIVSYNWYDTMVWILNVKVKSS